MLDHFNSTWTDKSINLYVDDGTIFASGTTILSSIRSAVQGLEEVLRWLANNGLRTDAEKSEVMIFHSHRVSPNLIGSRPSHIAYRDPFTVICVGVCTHDILNLNFPIFSDCHISSSSQYYR
jgi:hypothetical protein